MLKGKMNSTTYVSGAPKSGDRETLAEDKMFCNVKRNCKTRTKIGLNWSVSPAFAEWPIQLF